MKEKNKKCWNCSGYMPLYTRDGARFREEKFGTCKKHNKIVTKQDTCPNWLYRQMEMRKIQDLTLKSMTEIANKLAAIAEIIREENEYEQNILELCLEENRP